MGGAATASSGTPDELHRHVRSTEVHQLALLVGLAHGVAAEKVGNTEVRTLTMFRAAPGDPPWFGRNRVHEATIEMPERDVLDLRMPQGVMTFSSNVVESYVTKLIELCFRWVIFYEPARNGCLFLNALYLGTEPIAGLPL